MRTLTQEEFEQVAEPVFHQIFTANNDTEPFLPQVEERLLLYFPFGGNLKRNDYWEKQLAEALYQAAQFIGDTGCYLASPWEGNITTYGGYPQNRYAYIAISELVDALAASPENSKRVWARLNLIYGFGFCLCSTGGHWGLLKTIDDHAFLGGTHEFMQVVRYVFPDIDREALEYLHDLRLEQMDGEGIDVEWLKQVLSHVYGSSQAEQLIANSGLV